jgi:rhamnosyltransferase
MEGKGLVAKAENKDHAVVIPLWGEPSSGLEAYLQDLVIHGFSLILVDNNHCDSTSKALCFFEPNFLFNYNQGGIAGGLNRGIERACQLGSAWITLLDQDSRIPIQLIPLLREPWRTYPGSKLVVGPTILDERHKEHLLRCQSSGNAFRKTRLLITSGTTFRAADWPHLGTMNEDLFIDFVDHAWSFRAQARGFKLLQHKELILIQQFGIEHPSRLCHHLGLQLYSPMRHFYGIRNLRWLWLQPYVPLDLKVKELIKMLVKPWLWLLFEPHRRANLNAILSGILARLPGIY